MKFPFHLNLSDGLAAAGFTINNNATLTDSRITVNQLVRLDGIRVVVRIVLIVDKDTKISEATPYLNPMTSQVLDPVPDPTEFYSKLEKTLERGCQNLVGINLKPGVRGRGGSEIN